MGRVYDDAETLDLQDDPEKIQARHEAFELEQKTTKGLNELYQNQLSGLFEVDNDLISAEIQKSYDRMLKDNPERAQEVFNNLEKFQETKKALDEQKKQLKQFEKHGGLEGLQEKQRVLENASQGQGFFSKLSLRLESWRTGTSYQQTLEQIRTERKRATDEYKVNLQDLDTEVDKVANMVENAEQFAKEAELLRQKLTNIQQFLESDLILSSGLYDVAHSNLEIKLTEKLFELDDASLEEAKQMKRQLDSIVGENHEFPAMFNGVSPDFLATVNEINMAIQEKFITELKDSVTNTDLGKLEKTLKPYFMSEAIGDLSIQETREKVVEIFQGLADDPSVTKEKRFLLKILLLKNQHLIPTNGTI